MMRLDRAEGMSCPNCKWHWVDHWRIDDDTDHTCIFKCSKCQFNWSDDDDEMMKEALLLV